MELDEKFHRAWFQNRYFTFMMYHFHITFPTEQQLNSLTENHLLCEFVYVDKKGKPVKSPICQALLNLVINKYSNWISAWGCDLFNNKGLLNIYLKS